MMTRLMIFVAVFVACLVAACIADDDHGANAVSYTTEEFKENVDTVPHFVMFYAPWCGHCKRLAPTFDQLGTKYNVEGKKEKAVVAKVDCTVETALCSDEGVTGYPTLKFFKKDAEADKYRGSRDLDALEKYIEKQINPDAAAEEKKEEASGEAPKATLGLYELTDKNFKDHVGKGQHFVKFYAPWCGHCKKLAPTWDELARTFEKDDAVKISKVDCTVSGSLCGDQGVKGYPTLLFFKDGKNVDKYAGSRDHNALRDYVNKQKGKADPNAARTDEKVPEKKDEPKGAPGMTVLTEANFKDALKGKKALVKFYAPWCGHCKRLAPTWDDLAKAYEKEDFIIAKIDCTTDRQVCQDNDVKGYPTLLYFENGEMISKYAGGRELANLKEYVDKALGKKVVDPKPEEPVSEHIVVLTDDSFKSGISKGVTFVKFYAPWCGHCKNLAPTWEKLGEAFKGTPDVAIAKVDCTVAKTLCKEQEIQGFPTLVLFKEGEEIAEFEGKRDLDSLKQFVLDPPKQEEDDAPEAKKEEL